jgi:cytochrome c oxidase assembly protein subunit 11
MSGSAPEVSAANQLMLKKLLVVSVLMFGFGFALVPFYEQICKVTGLRDVFRDEGPAVQNTQVDATRSVNIEFDSNTQRLAWTFKPLQPYVAVNPGAVTQVVYEIRNTLDRPVTGQAVPSYGPANAVEYFKKLECFCFRQQTLAAGEVRRMPVVFVVDPALPKDIGTITLSYTFFEVAGTQGRS